MQIHISDLDPKRPKSNYSPKCPRQPRITPTLDIGGQGGKWEPRWVRMGFKPYRRQRNEESAETFVNSAVVVAETEEDEEPLIGASLSGMQHSSSSGSMNSPRPPPSPSPRLHSVLSSRGSGLLRKSSSRPMSAPMKWDKTAIPATKKRTHDAPSVEETLAVTEQIQAEAGDKLLPKAATQRAVAIQNRLVDHANNDTTQRMGRSAKMLEEWSLAHNIKHSLRHKAAKESARAGAKAGELHESEAELWAAAHAMVTAEIIQVQTEQEELELNRIEVSRENAAADALHRGIFQPPPTESKLRVPDESSPSPKPPGRSRSGRRPTASIIVEDEDEAEAERHRRRRRSSMAARAVAGPRPKVPQPPKQAKDTRANITAGTGVAAGILVDENRVFHNCHPTEHRDRQAIFGWMHRIKLWESRMGAHFKEHGGRRERHRPGAMNNVARLALAQQIRSDIKYPAFAEIFRDEDYDKFKGAFYSSAEEREKWLRMLRAARRQWMMARAQVDREDSAWDQAAAVTGGGVIELAADAATPSYVSDSCPFPKF